MFDKIIFFKYKTREIKATEKISKLLILIEMAVYIWRQWNELCILNT